MPNSGPEDWFKNEFKKAYEEQFKETGRFNLAIFGKTGVGKSTLVNAIFGEEIAETGIGEPVTKEQHLYLHETGFLGVLDTRGVEVGKDTDKIIRELSEYLRSMRRKPLSDQLHLAWYCVRATDRRFEDTEADFINELHELGLPVILVLTQVQRRSDGVVNPDAELLAKDIESRDLPIHGKRVYLAMAKPDDFTGHEAHGLKDLLDATFHAAPDGVQGAINAAQKIDQKRKRGAAKDAISMAVGAAGVAGATPIPFADAVVLVPIQTAMMAKVSQIYGIDVDKATTATLAATAAATAAGRSVVTSLIKFIPGGGTLIGGSISAAVASALTFAMGHAWVLICERIAKGEFVGLGGALDSTAIRTVFLQEFKAQAKKRMPKRT